MQLELKTNRFYFNIILKFSQAQNRRQNLWLRLVASSTPLHQWEAYRAANHQHLAAGGLAARQQAALTRRP
jgi:hypothetical protein